MVMKNLHLFLVFVFSVAIAMSCSSDDDNTSSIVETTFLEQYQGTVWHIAINEFNSEYLMFHNNETVPFEQWMLLSGLGCYENMSYNINEFNATITENSEDYLEITFPSGHTWIIAVDANVLHWVDVSEDGVYDYIYDKQSSDVVNGLEICYE